MSNPPRAASRAGTVALGILFSRLAGFVRERLVGACFGVGAYADVFQTALRAPNALQVLLGEGTLSASFIPVYVKLREEGREEEAGRFAGAIFGLLLAVTSAAVLAGMLLARPLVALLTPGYLLDAGAVAAGTLEVDRFPLAVQAVRWLFPMTGLLVLSVWALGVLNSHRRFFLSYFAPVLWNVAIVAALVAAMNGLLPTPWGDGLEGLLFAACLGALVGGLLQLLVQLPTVWRLLGGFRPSFSLAVPGVRQALAAFGPVVAGRGVVQLAGYLDQILASLLAAGAVTALGKAQYLYLLPVSLFGMSVAAAELPELARSGAGAPGQMVARLEAGLAQVAFLTVPTAVGYLALGYWLVGALFRAGRFGEPETVLVYLTLAGYSFGLLASTWSRLLQNSFYALADTRTPARWAMGRVALAALLGLPLMVWLDTFAVSEVAGSGAAGNLKLGALGLTLASGVAAWVELSGLRRALNRRLPELHLPWKRLATTLMLAVGAVLPALALAVWLDPRPAWLVAGVAVGVFGAVYLGAATLGGVSEVGRWLGRWNRRGG